MVQLKKKTEFPTEMHAQCKLSEEKGKFMGKPWYEVNMKTLAQFAQLSLFPFRIGKVTKVVIYFMNIPTTSKHE